MGMKQLASQLLKEIALAQQQQASLSNTTKSKAKPVKTTSPETAAEREKENYKKAFELFSKMKMAEFKTLLEGIVTEQDNILANDRSQAIAKGKITPDNVKPLLDFLSAYVADVTNTPLSFNYKYLLSNRILITLAKELDRVVGKHVLELLFPNLQLTEEFKKYKPDHLHHVVLSDDGKTFIDVQKCLDVAAENSKDSKTSSTLPLFHTHPVNGVKQELSAAEKWRVVRHTEQVYAYYQAIEKKQAEELEKAKAAFNAVHQPSEPFFAYEKVGRDRVFAALHKGITNRKELVAAMQKFATNHERKHFLKTFTPEELYKITLGEPGFNRETFKKVMKDAETYNFDNKSKHDECVTFLLLHVYGRYTATRPNQYNGLFASYAPRFMNSAQPASKKSEGVKAIENYYLDKEGKFSRIHTVSKSEAFKGCKAAIDDGLLHELYEQIQFVANSEGFESRQREKPKSWFGK